MNSNGVDDLYEALYPSILEVPLSSDSDGDGFSNAEEAASLTDPESPTDCLRCLPLIEDETSFTVRWPSKAGLGYQVEYSSDGTTWTNTGGPVTGDGTVRSLVVSKASLPGSGFDFFRVSTTTATDSDGDQVPDWAETLVGFDPNSAASVRTAANGGDLQQMTNLLSGGNPKGGLFGTSVAGTPSPETASRFLAQATFGPSLADIASLQALGDNAYEKWIDAQMVIPESYLSPYIDFLYARRSTDYQAYLDNGTLTPWPTVSTELEERRIQNRNISTPWVRTACFAPDQLRQRTAYALSEILVVGRRCAGFALGSTDYYDLLIEHSFGDFEDLLYEASVHPMMGWWLSSLGNEKADASINRFPDENYAREIMQLFSIGLNELNMDGTLKLDSAGEPIPTYDIDDIQEMARVFTGLWYQNANWGANPPNSATQNHMAEAPLAMFADRHDTGEKTLLNGVVLPSHESDAGRTGYDDIRDTCKMLVEHPNCAPFISKQLIQFLITSNPSPSFVERIAHVFVNDGNGNRGNLGAVVKAILLDPEARNPLPDLSNPEVGRLREPMIRMTMLVRASAAGAANPALHDETGIQYWQDSDAATELLQFPLEPPSVFNYFQPGYSKPGEVRGEGMVSPVFQILNSYTATTSLNLFWRYYGFGLHERTSGGTPEFRPLYTDSSNDGLDTELLLDETNLLYANGRLSAEGRSAIAPAVSIYSSLYLSYRYHTAHYLTMTSPSTAILK